MSDAAYFWACIFGLLLVIVLTRSAFLISERQASWPLWVETILRHAPTAALAAVVAPSLVLDHGHWPTTALDPRYLAAPVAMWIAWRRASVMQALLVGVLIYLALWYGVGWRG